MQVSCHMQNCVAIALLESGWMQNDSFYHIWNATGKITECAPRTSCFELPAEQNSCTMMLQYECYNVSNHQQLVGVFNYLFKLPLNPALLVHCERNPPVTNGFSSQRASNAESIFIAWRDHIDDLLFRLWVSPGIESQPERYWEIKALWFLSTGSWFESFFSEVMNCRWTFANWESTNRSCIVMFVFNQVPSSNISNVYADFKYKWHVAWAWTCGHIRTSNTPIRVLHDTYSDCQDLCTVNTHQL